ncbi:MAG TPA: allantoinase AllB, partial [Longimicrobiales bacterium]|nr:allantoinase AllB [Longimicrobiales bacterium]
MRRVFRSRSVLLPDGMRPATVHVRDGIIERIGEYEDAPSNELVDGGSVVLMPGLVDTHVHLNEPGRADWEGFASGTLAAAAGGVTTLVDMPLNSIPATVNVAALGAKREAAAGKCVVDVAFWGGVVPGNTADLEPLWHAGVCGFKCFLAPSGVAEFEHVTEADLIAALPILARLGAPLLVHAELPAHLHGGGPAHASYAAYLESRPQRAETEAVALLVRLAREHGAHIHVVHVSAAGTLALLRQAGEDGIAVSAETCPHYLTFDAASIADDATAFKCAPPIRAAVHREALWQGLASGALDHVASDHSPAPPDLKKGDWFDAWGGIASVQVALSATWTGARRRGHSLADVVRWMAERPARLAGLSAHKGAIAPGRDADLVLFAPDTEWTVSAHALHHRHAATPYDGLRLLGRVQSTWLRGARIYSDGSGTE